MLPIYHIVHIDGILRQGAMRPVLEASCVPKISLYWFFLPSAFSFCHVIVTSCASDLESELFSSDLTFASNIGN